MADFTNGTVVTATSLNAMLKVYGAGTPLVGSTSPPAASASSAYKFQFGTGSQTTNGAGGFNINFPVAFPTGVMSAGVMSAISGQFLFALIQANCTVSSLNGVAYLNNTAINSSAIGYVWWAVGW